MGIDSQVFLLTSQQALATSKTKPMVAKTTNRHRENPPASRLSPRVASTLRDENAFKSILSGLPMNEFRPTDCWNALFNKSVAGALRLGGDPLCNVDEAVEVTDFTHLG